MSRVLELVWARARTERARCGGGVVQTARRYTGGSFKLVSTPYTADRGMAGNGDSQREKKRDIDGIA